MPSRRTLLRAVGAGTAAVGLAGCIGETDDGDFPSRTIEFSVPTPSGSGYDVYARGLAEYLPEHLPDDVDIVVENITGGALTEQLNHVYRQDADGHTIGMSSSSIMTHAQLLDRIDFTIDELGYLGLVARTTSVIVTRPDTEIETPEDIADADDANFALGPRGTVGYVMSNALLDELDSPVSRITGFENVGDQTSATLRGDTDLNDGSTTAGGIRTGIEDGELEPVLTMRSEPYDGIYDLTDVPTIEDIDLGHLDPVGGFERIIITPPDLPDDIQETWVDALEATTQDEDFLATMEEQNSPVDFEDADAARAANEGMLEALEDYEEYIEE